MKAMKFSSTLVFFFVMMLLASCDKENSNNDDNNTDDCPSTVTDIDGNVYTVIKIGDQCWTLENLKVTKYNDGTPIATGLSDSEWENTTSGAYAIYEDNPAYGATYGYLYNGHAVATGKLCPQGWHIPTDAEWNTLEKFLGLSDDELTMTGERGSVEQIGGKMKATSLWNDPNTGATNSSGFTALPAGNRNGNGDYIVLNQYADFWTSTPYETDDNYLWNHHLYYMGAGVGRIYIDKSKGFSCRCIRDN